MALPVNQKGAYCCHFDPLTQQFEALPNAKYTFSMQVTPLRPLSDQEFRNVVLWMGNHATLDFLLRKGDLSIKEIAECARLRAWLNPHLIKVANIKVDGKVGSIDATFSKRLLASVRSAIQSLSI